MSDAHMIWVDASGARDPPALFAVTAGDHIGIGGKGDGGGRAASHSPVRCVPSAGSVSGQDNKLAPQFNQSPADGP